MIIYKITNKINNKVYIGLTTQTLKKRWNGHCADSKRGISRPLYRSMRLYGIENFTIEEIDRTSDLKSLGELERKYIEKYDSTNPNKGYNLTAGGEHNELDANPRARLTLKDVITIRDYYAECRLSCSECWLLYKDRISFSAFEKIWEGTTWEQVKKESYTQETLMWHKNHNNHKKLLGQENPQALYRDEEVLEIRKYYTNHTLQDCYLTFGKRSKSKTAFRNIIDRGYKHLPIYSKKDKCWKLNGQKIDINCYNYNPVSTISESGE